MSELHKLVARWREEDYLTNSGYRIKYDSDFQYGRETCADELEAALASTVEQEWKCSEPTCDMKRIPSLLYCSKHSAFSAENRAQDQEPIGIITDVKVAYQEGRAQALEEAADYVFKHWDTRISVAISDAIRALAQAKEKLCPGCGLPMSDGNGCHMARAKDTK